MNNDDIDDAQLDDFLNGKDDLSRRLRSLAQPAPDAALDDAILARAQQAMENDQRREAANDPGTPTRMRPLSWRWRVPAALAATVLVGVVAKQSFDATRDLNVAKQSEMSEVREVVVDMRVPSPPPPPPELIVESKPAPAAAAPAPAMAAPPVANIEAVKPVTPAAPAPAAEVPMPSPPVNAEAPAARDALSAPPKLSGGLDVDKARQDQQSAYGRAQASEAMGSVQKKADAQASIAQRQRQAVTAAPVHEAQAWLERIEALLKAGADKEALEEWKKFRAAYPEHPVPDAVSTRLRAISQQ